MLSQLNHSAVSAVAVLTLTGFLSMGALTGCSKKDATDVNNATAASVAEAAPPMTAAPADDKGTPVVINESNANVDAGSDINASVATSLDTSASAVATDMPHEAGDVEGGADNSGMDKISENDQVIDNEPASPNAPRASEESTGSSQEPTAVGNAKVGKN